MVTFDHIPVSEGDSFLLEDMKIDVLETPGHTPEHVSYIVSDTGRGTGPATISSLGEPEPMKPEEFRNATRDRNSIVLDVRSSEEYDNSHIDGAVNIPAPDLRTRFRELDPDSEILLVCSTGYRSTLAGSILLSNHFNKLHNVAGGMKGFNSTALAPACLMCSIPHGPRLLTGKLHDQVAAKTGEKTQ